VFLSRLCKMDYRLWKGGRLEHQPETEISTLRKAVDILRERGHEDLADRVAHVAEGMRQDMRRERARDQRPLDYGSRVG
jgi:hypothetical protein